MVPINKEIIILNSAPVIFANGIKKRFNPKLIIATPVVPNAVIFAPAEPTEFNNQIYKPSITKPILAIEANTTHIQLKVYLFPKSLITINSHTIINGIHKVIR